MNNQILTYISDNSKSEKDVDRLLASLFIDWNQVELSNNKFLKEYQITDTDEDYQTFQSLLNKAKKLKLSLGFEELIESFEFVVSPDDKIINGAIYTPIYIREYIVNQVLDRQNSKIQEGLFADISCGCGGFLYSLAIEIKKRSEQSYCEIFPRLYGLDITSYSIERTKILLSLLALLDGEDEETFSFNLHCGNALSFDWKQQCVEVKNNIGFDGIVGNPPYVCSRNMDHESLLLINDWSVSHSGHPDLYIPFFQIGIENLATNGELGYITVNSFFKSVNGRALRNFFSTNELDISIIDFGGEQVFRGRSTYTCLCFIQNKKGKGVNFLRKKSHEIDHKISNNYYFLPYSKLDDWNGWNLLDDKETEELISAIEETGTPFSKKYETRNGIATLKNRIFKFIPVTSTSAYHLLQDEENLIEIEKEICRPVINSNGIENNRTLKNNSEQIIFPYFYEGDLRKVIPEAELRHKFPKTYQYLLSKKEILAKRDKGRAEAEYEAWYIYGRTQSLDIKGYKLFFPHITDSPNFVISKDKDLLFYNGLAAFSDSISELKILKAILESSIFWFYITETSKYYVSGHRSISKNYIKKFGIPNFTEEERKILVGQYNFEKKESIIKSKYLLNLHSKKQDFSVSHLILEANTKDIEFQNYAK